MSAERCPTIAGRVTKPTPSPAGADKTPFQEVTDALTGGDGCACHTGTGYNTVCEHCWPAGTPLLEEGPRPPQQMKGER